MDKIQLGKSDLYVNPVGLGCMGFSHASGDPTEDDVAVTVYNSVFSNINNWYNRGESYYPIGRYSKFYNVDFYFKNRATTSSGFNQAIYNAYQCFFFNVNLYYDASLIDMYDMVIIGFSNCTGSIFQNCTASITPPQQKCYVDSSGKKRGYIFALGFHGNRNAVYYNCSGSNLCLKCEDETRDCLTPDI